jgi:hypothetical protein
MINNIRIIGALVSFLFFLSGCGNNGTFSTAGASPAISGVSPASAPVGATVTITGTNFSTTPANSAVSFNGTAAVVTSCTSTRIVTTVPSGATTGPITVTAGGNGAMSAASFIVMPSWKGTKQFGISSNEIGGGVTVDSRGNVYVIIDTTRWLEWNIDYPVRETILVKYDQSGTQQWTISDFAVYGSIAVDSSGNIYLAGNSTDGESNWGTLVKYDSSGTKQWTKHPGSPLLVTGGSVAVGSGGVIYITGLTAGWWPWDMDSHAYLVKCDSSGAELWTRQLGFIGDLAVDSSGNAYLIGSIPGGPSADDYDDYDTILVKYDTSGTKQWTRQLGSAGVDHGMGLAVDNSGNIYVTGTTVIALNGSMYAGGYDNMFLVKYDPSGTKLWTRQLGSDCNNRGFDVAVDDNGNAYVTGLIFNGRPVDMLLVKYDPSGNKQWTQQFGTSLEEWGLDVAVDNSGNAYVIGATSNSGGYDMFLVKYDPFGVKQ